MELLDHALAGGILTLLAIVNALVGQCEVGLYLVLDIGLDVPRNVTMFELLMPLLVLHLYNLRQV
jgi:hypothetical protein